MQVSIRFCLLNIEIMQALMLDLSDRGKLLGNEKILLDLHTF